MARDHVNDRGCPLHHQTGATAVQRFEAILAALSPVLRQAFEQERAARQAELDAYLAKRREHGLAHPYDQSEMWPA
jgi:hypothetical protein